MERAGHYCCTHAARLIPLRDSYFDIVPACLVAAARALAGAGPTRSFLASDAPWATKHYFLSVMDGLVQEWEIGAVDSPTYTHVDTMEYIL